MPGPGAIMGRWAALKLRDFISDWRKTRKTPKEDKFFSKVSEEPYFPGKNE